MNKLTIRLFPPKQQGKSYQAVGSLTMTVAEAREWAQWLLAQQGTFDDYAQTEVISMMAFQYANTVKSSGRAYTTVQLMPPREDDGIQPAAQPRPQQAAPASQPSPSDAF